MADNNVNVVGNLVADPELRFTAAGVPTAQLRVAVNRKWRDHKRNDWKEHTSFFSVVCWRDMAENVADSLQKGARVIVSGRLQQRSWETRDGERRSVVEIQAEDIGPSLRWATADVERSQPGGGNRQRGEDYTHGDAEAPF